MVFSQITDGPLPVRVEHPVIGLDVGGTKIAGGVGIVGLNELGGRAILGLATGGDGV